MRIYKKNKTTYLLILLLLGITLGYAYLNTELEINGTTNITSANWNVYWDNIQYGSNNVSTVNTPATISQGLTEVTFNVNFSEPGDTYEFTVDAVNDGSIDAMISVVSNGVYAINGTTPKALPAYLEYDVTYADGIAIGQNHMLESGDTETYKVRVHYKEDITASQLPSTNDNYVFKFSVTYVQANNNALSLQRIYTANIYDYNYQTIQDGTNTSVVWMNQALPNSITTYQTPVQAIAALKQAFETTNDSHLFLKHITLNNVVTDSYLGFIITPEMAQEDSAVTAGTYYLKGTKMYEYVNGDWQCMSQYDDGNGECVDPEYNNNVVILLKAFGTIDCTENGGGISCGTSGLVIYVFPNSTIYSYGGSWGCSLNTIGPNSSGCRS